MERSPRHVCRRTRPGCCGVACGGETRRDAATRTGCLKTTPMQTEEESLHGYVFAGSLSLLPLLSLPRLRRPRRRRLVPRLRRIVPDTSSTSKRRLLCLLLLPLLLFLVRRRRHRVRLPRVVRANKNGRCHRRAPGHSRRLAPSHRRLLGRRRRRRHHTATYLAAARSSLPSFAAKNRRRDAVKPLTAGACEPRCTSTTALSLRSSAGSNGLLPSGR